MFINDTISCISQETKIVLYADDTKIWHEIIDWNDHLALQNDIVDGIVDGMKLYLHIMLNEIRS